MHRRSLVAVVAAGLLTPLSGAATASTPTEGRAALDAVVSVCDRPLPGEAGCLASRRTGVRPLGTAGTPSGYGPKDLQGAYKLPSATRGTGQTIAIVDAYDHPRAEQDLAVYRSKFGLKPCTTANSCFRKVNQNGTAGSYPPGDTGWAQEISLDLDMASAICPNCKLLLVEARTASLRDLGASVNTAVRLGAQVVSNSYGSAGDLADASYGSYYNHPGRVITAASGDYGFGLSYPASSRYVTAVGGTTLTRAGNARGWAESVWTGAGSGCSTENAKPAWQHDTGCAKRTVADVSAVADPATGVAVYHSYGANGWLVFGGTSVAAPIIAGVYALAGNAGAVTYGSYPYRHRQGLFDVASGKNGSCGGYLCTGRVGYDGPSGLGTPNGISAF
ncbi:MAG: S53 family peptidase [Mycobacteriales bacterium]